MDGEDKIWCALIDKDGNRTFAGYDMDDAVKLLAESDDMDDYIGFIYNGECTMTWTRNDVFPIDLVVMDVRKGYAISTIVESIEQADELWESDKAITDKEQHQRVAYFLGKFYTYNDDIVSEMLELVKTYMGNPS